jgi:hypothetical protein
MMIDRNKQVFVTSRFRMMKTLIACKTDKSIVAVWSTVFGNLLRLCRVEEICTDEDENEVMVILKPCEEEGCRPDSFTLFLNEIEQLGILSSPFHARSKIT